MAAILCIIRESYTRGRSFWSFRGKPRARGDRRQIGQRGGLKFPRPGIKSTSHGHPIRLGWLVRCMQGGKEEFLSQMYVFTGEAYRCEDLVWKGHLCFF